MPPRPRPVRQPPRPCATRRASHCGPSRVWPPRFPRWARVTAADFQAAARRQRVTAVLSQQATAIGLPDEVWVALLEARPGRRLRSLRQVRCLFEVAQVLERSGIPALFFKGPCLAMQTTGDVSARDGGDIDVLVAPADVPGAVQALERAGWPRRAGLPTDPRSFGWRYQLWGSCELPLDGPLGTVDLHWRLDPTREGLPGFDALWSRRSAVSIGGADFASLCREDALIHSCHHAAKDRWLYLRSLVDVHRLLRETAVPPGRSPVADAAVAVVDAVVGLPVQAEGSRASPRRAAVAVRAALRAQDEPVVMHRPAGLGTYRAVRYNLASGHGPANLVRTLAVATVPPESFAANHARTAPVALVSVVPRRIIRVGLRILDRVESASTADWPPRSGRGTAL